MSAPSTPNVTIPPDRAICALVDLHAQPALELQYGRNLFVGPVRAMNLAPDELPPQVPGRAVFVLVTGGERPQMEHGPEVLRTSWVQVAVRGPRDDFEAGQRLARGVWRAVHNKMPDNYQVVECQESEPNYQGAPEDHHEWLIMLRVQYWDQPAA